MTGLPPTRWELAGPDTRGYGECFGRMVAGGEDVDGEARFVDVLAPRGARILDVGSGMGRVSEALRRDSTPCASRAKTHGFHVW